MAGAGARLFPENSKLTSAQVNTYLMDQTIMRFATTTARDAAFGGVGEPTLAEGMTCYIDADNSIYTYDGSNWIRMVSASTPPALQLVKVQTIGTGVGLSGETVTNAFSSEFDDYLITIDGGSGTTGVELSVRLGSSTSNYNWGIVYTTYAAATPLAIRSSGGASSAMFQYVGRATTSTLTMHATIRQPFLTRPTYLTTNYVAEDATGVFGGIHTDSTSHTSFTIFPQLGTITGGVIRVYGYRNS